jgi:hypothetical protein
VPSRWHIWGTSGNEISTTRVSSTSPRGTWSWKRQQSKSASGQPWCSYTSPLTSTTIGSLKKYQLSSFTLTLQIEGCDTNITCGQQQDWLEEDKVGTVIRLLELLGGQDTIAPTFTVRADSTYQKSAQGCTPGALAKSARCCPCMITMSHVIACALTSQCTLAATTWTRRKRHMP